ncbi:MAG: hypothetical protein NT067_04640 [Candidatus Diapherotrites archaeon]|nr:hypothetical protein [Candidatus Diapherotrites archaeon]
MAVFVNSRFTPLRMVLSRREPVQLTLYLRNENDKETKLTVRITLSTRLSFTKGGFKNSELVRIDSIKPNEEKTLYFQIFPKASTDPGDEPVEVRVQEHYGNFQFADKQYENTITLKVDE